MTNHTIATSSKPARTPLWHSLLWATVGTAILVSGTVTFDLAHESLFVLLGLSAPFWIGIAIDRYVDRKVVERARGDAKPATAPAAGMAVRPSYA